MTCFDKLYLVFVGYECWITVFPTMSRGNVDKNTMGKSNIPYRQQSCFVEQTTYEKMKEETTKNGQHNEKKSKVTIECEEV
jgi:hypothetical protein